MWGSVRNGEEKWIFPYQDLADVAFNSAIEYEMCALATKALPLLHAIPPESKAYTHARRLLDLLNLFSPVPATHVPANSLLREFLGGGTLHDN
ncbi:hypothetical protein KIPB_013517 [Kipferlia bialata]|uniref:Uncharacterized protein n=1 Tax=Kipferlia bialata TaxID=797122 RepID=A0A9K3D844_9EUKA|nr:hypothetical protein KIPB_013517 [Kipferlia bialata]|eukprot:g13517.t1